MHLQNEYAKIISNYEDKKVYRQVFTRSKRACSNEDLAMWSSCNTQLKALPYGHSEGNNAQNESPCCNRKSLLVQKGDRVYIL